MSDGTRRVLSFLALAVAAGLLFVADGTSYFDRNLLDSSAFADHATDALEKESVRRELSREIAIQVERVSPGAAAYRGQLETAADRMIATRRFRRIFRAGALEVHRFAFDDRRTALLLDLRNVDGPLTRAAERIDPALAASIPDGFDARVAEISDEVDRTLGDLQTFSERAGGLADLTLVGGLIFLVLSVVLAVNRYVAVSRVGLLMAALGLIYVAGYYVARALLSSELDDEVGKEAVKGAWDAVVGGLRDWNIGLCLAGLLLAGTAAFARTRTRGPAPEGW
jgi:hypothetical protein